MRGDPSPPVPYSGGVGVCEVCVLTPPLPSLTAGVWVAPPEPLKPQVEPGDYAWSSGSGDFRFAAVAAENSECSRIGK